MIGKICPRGENVAGLIRYLYGPGRFEEHTDPHILAGYLDPDCLEPGLRPDGQRDFRRLVSRLRLPHDRQGSLGCAKPVWHCSMRAAPEDRMLSDAEWAQIARDVMGRTGLSPHGQDDQGVRWIAVRHGPDHIHLVAMLARQDAARVSTWNTRYRVRDACIAAEQRYGLRSTAPADRTASRGPTRAETGKAERRGLGEPPRVTLRRHVATAAATAASAEEFFARLGQAGVQVRVRYSTKNPGQVTGYSVALLGDTTRDGTAVWHGGGKLAADLSWPKLAHRWAAGPQPVPHLTIQERQHLWEYAASVAGHAAAQIRAWSLTSPEAAADAAWAAGDALRVTATALGSRILRQAADGFDRAARERYGRIPVRNHDRTDAPFGCPGDERRPGRTRAVSIGLYPGVDENPRASRFNQNRRTADLTASAQHFYPKATISAGMSHRPVRGRCKGPNILGRSDSPQPADGGRHLGIGQLPAVCGVADRQHLCDVL